MGMLRNGDGVGMHPAASDAPTGRHSKILLPPRDHDVLCYSRPRVIIVILVTDSLCGFFENVLNSVYDAYRPLMAQLRSTVSFVKLGLLCSLSCLGY